MPLQLTPEKQLIGGSQNGLQALPYSGRTPSSPNLSSHLRVLHHVYRTLDTSGLLLLQLWQSWRKKLMVALLCELHVVSSHLQRCSLQQMRSVIDGSSCKTACM